MKVISNKFPFKIISSSVVKPERNFSNIEILERIPEFSEKSNNYLKAADRRIQQNYGYEGRYLSYSPLLNYDDGTTSEDLAISAIKACLLKTTLLPDLIIHGTTTSSRYTSTQAAALAQALNHLTPSFEIKAGCASGMVALQNAFAWMAQGYENCMVVVAETLSRVQSLKNHSSSLGLADAAAALFLQRSSQETAEFVCEKILYYTDGSAANLMTSRALLPLKPGTVVEDQFAISGNETLFQEMATQHYGNMIKKILPEENDRKSITWVLSHQVNRSLIEKCLLENGVSGQALWINQDYGNIGCVSIPALIHQYNQEKNLFKKNDRLLLITVGGGMNCQAQIWLKN